MKSQEDTFPEDSRKRQTLSKKKGLQKEGRLRTEKKKKMRYEKMRLGGEEK